MALLRHLRGGLLLLKQPPRKKPRQFPAGACQFVQNRSYQLRCARSSMLTVFWSFNSYTAPGFAVLATAGATTEPEYFWSRWL